MESLIDASADEVYGWHARPEALHELTPPGGNVRVLRVEGEPLAVGTVVVVRLPFGLRWTAVHTACEPGRMFRDEQSRGPFRSWVHTHRFEPLGDTRSRLIDDVEYSLHCRRWAGGIVERRLRRLFTYRHDRTRAFFGSDANV